MLWESECQMPVFAHRLYSAFVVIRSVEKGYAARCLDDGRRLAVLEAFAVQQYSRDAKKESTA